MSPIPCITREQKVERPLADGLTGLGNLGILDPELMVAVSVPARGRRCVSVSAGSDHADFSSVQCP
jgi:hypothetical protein